LDRRHAGQRVRLEQVGRHDRRERHDLLAQRVVGVERRTGLLPLADEHRVEHDVAPLLPAQALGDDVDGRGRAEHAEHDDARVVGGRRGLHLLRDDLGGHGEEPVVPVVRGVERHEAGHGAEPERAELLE
ncbi:hypothetical protein AEA42_14125, partial [Shewanella sp. Sh95]